MPEPIEAEATEIGTDLAVAPPVNLFRSDDPATVLGRARETAEALMPVVREKGLVANIQGREHLKVEGWQTLGAMLGVTPVCTWTRKLDNGWEARVEARTLDGRVIGAAEAECLRSESQWEKRDDFALRSMAQTRATSKALASVLRFVATLAGMEGTPAEEMPRESSTSGPVTKDQARELARLLTKSPISLDARRAFNAWAPANLKSGMAGRLIRTLSEDPEKGADMAAQLAGFSDTPVDDEANPQDRAGYEGDGAENLS